MTKGSGNSSRWETGGSVSSTSQKRLANSSVISASTGPSSKNNPGHTKVKSSSNSRQKVRSTSPKNKGRKSNDEDDDKMIGPTPPKVIAIRSTTPPPPITATAEQLVGSNHSMDFATLGRGGGMEDGGPPSGMIPRPTAYRRSTSGGSGRYQNRTSMNTNNSDSAHRNRSFVEGGSLAQCSIAESGESDIDSDEDEDQENVASIAGDDDQEQDDGREDDEVSAACSCSVVRPEDGEEEDFDDDDEASEQEASEDNNPDQEEEEEQQQPPPTRRPLVSRLSNSRMLQEAQDALQARARAHAADDKDQKKKEDSNHGQHQQEQDETEEDRASRLGAAIAEVREALQEQVQQALQRVSLISSTRAATSGGGPSSDYWKGLLVGIFAVQSIFVPLFAALATGGTSDGMWGFLQSFVWRWMVWMLTGVGFVVIAWIAIQYDRALQDELQELRRRVEANASHHSATTHVSTCSAKQHQTTATVASRHSAPPASGRKTPRRTASNTTGAGRSARRDRTTTRSTSPTPSAASSPAVVVAQPVAVATPQQRRRRRREQQQREEQQRNEGPTRRQDGPRQPRRRDTIAVVPIATTTPVQQQQQQAAETNSVSETMPSTASGHDEEPPIVSAVAATTMSNDGDKTDKRSRSVAEKREEQRRGAATARDTGDDDFDDYDENVDRPPTDMIVTSSRSVNNDNNNQRTAHQQSNNSKKSQSFMSQNNRSMFSLSSHTEQNQEGDRTGIIIGDPDLLDDDESLTAPTKDITFTQSANQPASVKSSSQQQPASTADFYPDATVLFAHISGFTAWSSERGPDQIFLLLEKLHQRFDDAAKRLEITKVESTSESYMAVAGVPQAQSDHAVRMVKFAKQVMQSMVNIVNGLEGTLGPDTGSLRLRIGIHSGSVTAGVLGGRFQVLGNTVGLASQMETTSHRHRIQISEGTAALLRKAEKEDWIQKREDNVAKSVDGRDLQTYFVVITSPLTGRGQSSYQGQKSTMSLLSLRSGRSGVVSHAGAAATNLAADNIPKRPTRRQVWGDGEDNFMMSLPPMSRTAKNKRLVAWVNKMLTAQLVKVMSQRGNSSRSEFEITEEVIERVAHGEVPMDEFVDVIKPARAHFASDRSTITDDMPDPSPPAKATQQLRSLVTKIAELYADSNPFHSFEHAAHTTMSAEKLLNRCAAQDEEDYLGEMSCASRSNASRSAPRQYMNSIAADALSQWGVLFAALTHDCGHQGLSSRQLTRLNPKLSEKYNHESVAEQNSIDLAWNLFVDPEFADLQKCLFSNESELRRFRELLVNCLLATDLNNGKSQARRDKRWDRAFQMEGESGTQDEDADLKATAVVECLVQASDISHAMQHVKVFKKWNERLFREKTIAYDAGKSFCNPLETWYQEELTFLDKYAIPLAKKLAESGVFGVASNECLNHALENRKEWERSGEQLVQDMHERYCKRKEMEIGGFTNEEINNFTPKELEYIMKKLVEKGRNRGTNEVDEEKGQNDAAQAWLDALEIYERCPAAMEIADRSIIFPIYSGVFVWIKGDKIPQDPDGYFEVNIAKKFVQESKLHLDPIHHTRALAMLAEVYGRQGNYKAALTEFQKLAEIYSFEAHSAAIAEVYGTDRSAQAFSFSAIWHDQLGNSQEAVAACEYVIQDLLPMMDPTNTLGNFELLLNVIYVMKPRGQEKRMRRLLKDYVISAFRKHHGPSGFTPCMGLFKPLTWLLEICADPARFRDLDEAVEWLSEDENGVSDEFLDSIYAKACWSTHDMIAELCLRVANRLALEDGDIKQQWVLVRKGLTLARRAECKMRDADGNVILPIANAMHEPVYNALEEVAKQMGVHCEETKVPKGKQLNVNLPPSYLRAPDEASS